MNQDQFNKLTEKLLTACKDALGMKAGEYAREGDRLHNFYAAARKRNQHPLDSLLGMQVKHRVSIDDICEDIVKHGKFPTDEMMLEKFKDDINYNLLAFALIHELREKARKEAFKKGPETSGHQNLGRQVEHKGNKYLSVEDEISGCCNGCYFEHENPQGENICQDFRNKFTCGSPCFDGGIIWKKIV